MAKRCRSRSRSPERSCSICIWPVTELGLSLYEAQAMFRKCGVVEGTLVEGDAAIVTFSEAHSAREAVRRFHRGELRRHPFIDVVLVNATVQERAYTHVRVSRLSGETVLGAKSYFWPLEAWVLRDEVAELVGKDPRECRLAHQNENLKSGDIVPWGRASEPVEIILIILDLPKDRRNVFVTGLPLDTEKLAWCLRVFQTCGEVVDVQTHQPGSATIQYKTLKGAGRAVRRLHGQDCIFRQGALYNVTGQGAPPLNVTGQELYTIKATQSPLPPARPLDAEELPTDDRFVLFEAIHDEVPQIIAQEFSRRFGSRRFFWSRVLCNYIGAGGVFYIEFGYGTPQRALVGYDTADKARETAQMMDGFPYVTAMQCAGWE
jgi:hypothetical protein